VSKELARRSQRVTFEVRITNRGDASDRMELRGTPKNGKFKVTYLAGGRNVTQAVTSGTYRTDSLVPGESATVFVMVTRTRAAVPGARRTFEIRAESLRGLTRRDTVRAVVFVGGRTGRAI
jgi:uncharacterized membrane protein